MSHAWQEGIFEFLSKVLASWPQKAFNAWCCMLANPQNLNIGSMLQSPKTSPFALALQASRFVLVVPNRHQSIYTRLWCGYEVGSRRKSPRKGIECDRIAPKIGSLGGRMHRNASRARLMWPRRRRKSFGWPPPPWPAPCRLLRAHLVMFPSMFIVFYSFTELEKKGIKSSTRQKGHENGAKMRCDVSLYAL